MSQCLRGIKSERKIILDINRNIKSSKCVLNYLWTHLRKRDKKVWCVLKKKYLSSTCLETAFACFDDSLHFAVSTSIVAEVSLGEQFKWSSKYNLKLYEPRQIAFGFNEENLHEPAFKQEWERRVKTNSNLSKATVCIQDSDSAIYYLQQQLLLKGTCNTLYIQQNSKCHW